MDSQLVVFGGCGPKRPSEPTVFNDLPCLDLVDMMWTIRQAKGTLPSPRYWHTAALVDRKLIVIGGCVAPSRGPVPPTPPPV